MKKFFLISFCLLLVIGIQAQDKKEPKPVAPYTPAVMANGTLYVSGQIPRIPETGKMIKGDIKKIPLDQLKGHTSAVMVLPYPPGIPLIMPGEKITDESDDILEYLRMLERIGKKLPGFASDIHGVELTADNELLISVLNR